LTLLIRNALRRALVKPVTLALEPCYSRRIRFSGADVELLSIPAGYVGVRHAQIRVGTFIDRLGRCQATQWHERSETYQYEEVTRWHRSNLCGAQSRGQDSEQTPWGIHSSRYTLRPLKLVRRVRGACAIVGVA